MGTLAHVRYNRDMIFFKTLVPDWLLKAVRPLYHGCIALGAHWYYGRPSESLVVIGITGTAGKSTTAAMLSHILNAAGKKCGYLTTVNFFDGEKDFINKHGLSMPGGPLLQKSLRQMVERGCKYAVVECTSEGLAQNRHMGINFDAALFTNLSEAHVEAHGSFENYKAAKGKLFAALSRHKKKSMLPKKLIGVNLDDAQSSYFANFSADEKFGVTFEGQKLVATSKIYAAKKSETGFLLENQQFVVQVVGDFNLYNALLATACANTLGVALPIAQQALQNFSGIRGRMEPVFNGRGIHIFVDYGCEPASIVGALHAANAVVHNRLIHVFGATGGHRDVSKRFVFGKASAELADVSIITNDDVYDSDPQEIADNILEGFNSIPASQRKASEIYTILDRYEAIKKALSLARPDDLILITGKGSEQFLVLPGNKRIEWDEVNEVKKLL